MFSVPDCPVLFFTPCGVSIGTASAFTPTVTLAAGMHASWGLAFFYTIHSSFCGLEEDRNGKQGCGDDMRAFFNDSLMMRFGRVLSSG